MKYKWNLKPLPDESSVLRLCSEIYKTAKSAQRSIVQLLLQRKIETMLSKKYKSRLEDTDMIILCKKTDSYILKFDCRLQFDSFLTVSYTHLTLPTIYSV